VDVAVNSSGDSLFLLLQSYMPAQEMHILKNPGDPAISPWYRYMPDRPLDTPEWRFGENRLRRFQDRPCDHVPR
jgi:hypothetical protein